MSGRITRRPGRKAGHGPLSALALLMLAGCVRQAAPSFSLFGAYFPGWLACALIGVVGAIAARIGFVASGLAQQLPFQTLICAGAGVIVASLCWLFWLGQ